MDNTNRELSIPFKIMIALIMAFVYAALNILLADFSLVEVPYVSIRPQLILPLLSGYLLGPFYGFTVGFLGNAMSDMVTGYGIEFLLNWSIANGLYGLIMGFFPKNEDKIRTNRSFTIFFFIYSAGQHCPRSLCPADAGRGTWSRCPAKIHWPGATHCCLKYACLHAAFPDSTDVFEKD